MVQRETSSCDNMVCLCQAQRNVAIDVKSVFVIETLRMKNAISKVQVFISCQKEKQYESFEYSVYAAFILRKHPFR